jgi:carboxymethylenebutenolidase
MTQINIATNDGSFDAYLARPADGTTPRGGVIVIQEIFGVNQNIRDVADWLASEGYLALAPDLFWRIEPNVSLTDQTEAEWQKAFALMNAFDGDLGVPLRYSSSRRTRHWFWCFSAYR